MGFSLGGLIGGSAPPPPNFSASTSYMGALTGIGAGLGQTAAQTGNLYNSNSAQLQQAQNAYSQYLQSNPATETFNAGQVAGAENGASEAATRAGANLDESLASRGISPSSSIGVGGQAGIQEGLAANDDNIQNTNANNNIATHAANLGTLNNMLSGATNNAFSQNQGATGQQIGVNQNLVSTADQQAMDQYQAAAQTYAQNSQNADAFLSTIGSLGGSLGGAAIKKG